MSPERLRVVTGLAGDGAWRAELALDRSVTPARAVLLARVPPSMASDALALAALARGMDLAARVTHPAVRRVLGVAEAGGDMVVLEGWHEGETLEWLLRTGGPLSPPLAARVAVELAGALHAVHTLAAAGGKPLAHGDLRGDRVLVTEDGAVLLCGLGRPAAEAGNPPADVRALARLLAECLPPNREEAPAAMGEVIERALSSEGFASAKEFGEAVEAAVAPAPRGALAARLEAVLPPGRPAWQARRSALAQAVEAEERLRAEASAPSAGAPAQVLPPPVAPSPSGPVPPAVPSPPSGPTVPVAAPAPPASSTRPTRPGSLEAQVGPDTSPLPPEPPAPVERSRVTAPAVDVRALAAEETGPTYVEVEPAADGPTEAPAIAASPLVAILSGPRAPWLVGAAAAAVGLLLGLLLGGR